MNFDKVEQLICELLIELGGDPDREGLVRTPTRVAAPVEYLTSGYRGRTAHINASRVCCPRHRRRSRTTTALAHDPQQSVVADR